MSSCMHTRCRHTITNCCLWTHVHKMLLSLCCAVSAQHVLHNGHSRRPQDGGGWGSRVWRLSRGGCDVRWCDVLWSGCHMVWGGSDVMWDGCLLQLLKRVGIVTCRQFFTASCVCFLQYEAEDANAMVFCDVCNVCVHQVGVLLLQLFALVCWLYYITLVLNIQPCYVTYLMCMLYCVWLCSLYPCSLVDIWPGDHVGLCGALCRLGYKASLCGPPSLPPKACYGVESIPDGSWLCDVCKTKEANPKCVLCPNVGGAMKNTEYVLLHLPLR